MEILSHFPERPGVYIFRDAQKKPLYVGKAANLKNRVSSYFQKDLQLGPKTAEMVRQAEQIEHLETESEIEALLLESDLIKRLKPKYNIRWRDDKNYKYIKITQSAKRKTQSHSVKLKTKKPELFGKVVTSRSTEDKDALYFGPFPEGNTVKRVLKILRKIFPFRDCSKTKFNRYQKLNRPCLYGELNLCLAPCIGQINPKDYQKTIKNLIKFLSGKKRSVIRDLEKEMRKKALKKDFEEAAKLRDQVYALEYVTQSFRLAADYLKHPDLLEDQRRKELHELERELKFATTKEDIRPLHRIEAYDISNIQGRDAVGSMVVFVDGNPDKSQHRRFRIKTKQAPDDVAMIKEVLRRRLTRMGKQIDADKSFAEIPDLILVDGGKPQVSAVLGVLKSSGLKIPVIGLAKKEETVISNQLSVIRPPKGSPALHLLQRIRDEAHRFAVSYHRKLRAKVIK